MAADMQNLNRLVAQRNLERLYRYNITVPGPPSNGRDNVGVMDQCHLTLSILKHWSDSNKESIQKAIAGQAFGKKSPINWNLAFLPFMESMAVYLRDYGKVLDAHAQYSRWRDPEVETGPQDLEDAINTYISAADQIDELAKEWGMRFMQICDLPHVGPEKEPKWSGPYCGAFYTTDVQKSNPFIGLAFKGTAPFNFGEIATDKNYELVAAVDFLNGQSVSDGVYTGLFSDFSDEGQPAYKPYNHIFEQLGAIANTLPRDEDATVRAHVTGHSLGGSYSSLCAAQLLIDAPKLLPGFKTGDEYTFGAPRVGSNDWALMKRQLADAGDGQTWRIVNDGDIVPQVPPTDLFKAQGFYHTDQGVTIFGSKGPERIKSEINGPLPPGREFKSWKKFFQAVRDTAPHFPNSYYKAMMQAVESTAT